MKGEKVKNLSRLKGSTVAGGAISKIQEVSIKVGSERTKPNGGPKLMERLIKHQSKGKK